MSAAKLFARINAVSQTVEATSVFQSVGIELFSQALLDASSDCLVSWCSAFRTPVNVWKAAPQTFDQLLKTLLK